jgi:hypothetical protein
MIDDGSDLLVMLVFLLGLNQIWPECFSLCLLTTIIVYDN